MSERTPFHDDAAAAGAIFADDAGWSVPAHYGDPSIEYWMACQDAALFDLSHHGKVVVSGPDARSFLHNLCTNDVVNLAVGSGCEAFLLTAKARTVAHALVYRLSDAEGGSVCWLDVAPGMAPRVVEHLNRFLISEQVELADRTTEYAQLHLAGPQARMILTRATGEELPDLAPLQHITGRVGSIDGCQIRRHDPLGLPGFDLLVPAAQAHAIWQSLRQAAARPAGLAAYDILRVEAGTPRYGIDMDESHLAMEIGRTSQAISFKKGCYLGQEPVVRSRDLGHVNRTLLGLRVTGETAVGPGAKVFHQGKEVGYVTSSVVAPGLGTAIALAYIRRGSQEPGTTVEVETGGNRRAAEVASLPFPGAGAS